MKIIFFSSTDKAIESIINPQIIPSSMIQKLCTSIWITYDSSKSIPLFEKEASHYFVILKFLAKSPIVDIQLECRRNVNILINIYYLKVIYVLI